MDRIDRGGLKVAGVLADFIEREVLPGTHVHRKGFWQGFEALINRLAPVNRALLQKREALQQQIDDWHAEHRGQDFDVDAYRSFLEQIGYLVTEAEDFLITTTKVDPEISQIAGPQLVVPLDNARFALNAANARWGSLFDALYGTDVIEENDDLQRLVTYNPSRGAKVFEFVNNFLDQAIPLDDASHSDVSEYRLIDGLDHHKHVEFVLKDGSCTSLSDEDAFVGYCYADDIVSRLLFRNHGLHIEMKFDPNVSECQRHPAGLCDVILESAVTSIQDLEDSVAAVDAEDKVVAYRNWLGLMKGTLTAKFQKGYRPTERSMSPDRDYRSPEGEFFTLPGRSTMMVRNVGHSMTSDAILDRDGNEVPEGIIDAVITSLIAVHDLKRGPLGNSRTGSVYIVKPKLHGPEEAAFAAKLFGQVEALLGLPYNTLKLGMMDEERRTSINLKACIAELKERIIFINTGFLDRTGDEIHTCMEAGAMQRKEDVKKQRWFDVYEDNNVSAGLMTGMPGHGQIGKGMWPKPDAMFEMLTDKIDHTLAGANCAWVPSPTAATLHAIHYHMVDVHRRQLLLSHNPPADIDKMLSIPTLQQNELSESKILREIDNNVQGILGYIVRWIDQGIGCSKVPDIGNTNLMEDRATLRISSQHLANWLHHGICSESQVMSSLRRLAVTVDNQNAGDSRYCRMSDDLDNNLAYQAALELIFEGRAQLNGYTEPVLHRYRRKAKAAQMALAHQPLAVANR